MSEVETEEEAEELVELDLETGETFPRGQGPPPNLFLKMLSTVFVGTRIGDWADKQIGPATSLNAVIDVYASQLTLFKVGIWLASCAVIAIGHQVHPWLGAFVLTLYLFYFCLINVTRIGDKILTMRRQAVVIKQYNEQAVATSELPDQGQYL